MPQSFVCVHNPLNPQLVGAIRLQGAAVEPQSVHLPIEPDLVSRWQLGGVVRRSWGSGWFFQKNRSEGGSPLALQVRSGDSRLHWAAEVTEMPNEPRPVARGKLQLVLVRSAVGVLSPGFSQVVQPEPFQLEKGQSLILRGSIQLNTLLDGFVALQLWGVCGGVAVRWIAVTQSGANE